ncbi:hypothetical protein IFR04_005331 [Cadophora malorum]|uniref:Major facilitator superfamily (MFS) profile domain-containing protein n=1 Tax=Cadophora malorum TaxID=108018 RepID=A0A8H7TKZ7_9HELO|nr:hypothetical protein IFR04_005331 [Cadophora malorum]
MNLHVTPPITFSDLPTKDKESKDTTGVISPERTAEDQVSEAIPDGGYGWIVLAACFIHTFWLNAWTGSWGILQVALLKTTLKGSSSSTVSFIGSLGLGMSVGLSIVAIPIARKIGARFTSLIGIIIYGTGLVASGFAVHSVGGMFVACGVSYGLSIALIYTMTNSLPVQWFHKRLGAANGIVKLGGGIGATIMALITGVLVEKLGVAWTFRIMGLLSLATGVPAAFLIRERHPAGGSFVIDWSMFKDASFCYLLASGAIGVFAVYVPSFFLPYVGNSIGLSNSTVSGVVACFNASMAIGRLGSGYACDQFGAINMMLSTMALNAITFFAIWSFSSTLAVLIVFSILNGMANGAFFVTLPTAIARHVGPSRASAAISVTITAWAPGLLLGNPIAGFLIDATGADKGTSILFFGICGAIESEQ